MFSCLGETWSRAASPPHQKEPAEVVGQASGRCSMDASLRKFSGHVHLAGHSGEAVDVSKVRGCILQWPNLKAKTSSNSSVLHVLPLS